MSTTYRPLRPRPMAGLADAIGGIATDVLTILAFIGYSLAFIGYSKE